MRDTATLEARPAVVFARPGLTASEIIGFYAVEPAPLNSGRHYRTVRIESAQADVSGRLTYIHARHVQIDGNGSMTRESDRVRLMGWVPGKYFANALSAEYACDRANDLTDRMLEIGRTLEGDAWREHRREYESLIAGHLGRRS